MKRGLNQEDFNLDARPLRRVLRVQRIAGQ